MTPASIGARLLGLVLPAQTARKFALPGFILAAALALLLGLGLFKAGWAAFDWFNDREAVEQDRRAANAEFAEKQLEAERGAGAAKRSRDARDAKTQEGLDDEVDEANRDGRSAADDVWNGGLFDTADD